MKCCVRHTRSNMVDNVEGTVVEENNKGPLDNNQSSDLDGAENHTSALHVDMGVDMVVPNTGVDMAAADGVTKHSAVQAACWDIQHMD